MELKIDELISCVDDQQITIVAIDLASVKRIKELTFSKISPNESRSAAARRRPVAFGILVAILASLLITAAAVSIPSMLSGYRENSYVYHVTEDGQIYLPYECPNWGIEFSASNISPTGLELTCTHTDGDYTGRLSIEPGYYLMIKTNSGWEVLPRLNGIIAWEGEGIVIGRNSTYTRTLDWSTIYGELQPGTYKLCIHVSEIQNKEFNQSNEYCVEFVIAEP